MAEFPTEARKAQRVQSYLSEPRRPRWKRRLLGCLALLVLGAGVAGWMWYAGAEGRAARLVESLGGRVRYSDGQRSDGQVVSIELRGESVTDGELARLAPLWLKFPHLENLDLSGSRVTDAGLETLRGAELKSLILDSTAVGDEGLKHVASVRGLRSLSLGGTRVGDGGLEHLARMPQLSALYLEGTGVTDAGLPALSRLESLRYLRLPEGTDGPGLQTLRRSLPELRVSFR